MEDRVRHRVVVKVPIVVQMMLWQRLLGTHPRLLEGTSSEGREADANLLHRAQERIKPFCLLPVRQIMARRVEEEPLIGRILQLLRLWLALVHLAVGVAEAVARGRRRAEYLRDVVA